MKRWTVRLFGGVSVEGEDTHVDQFPTRRSAMILTLLALSRQGAISRDELAETLWPEDFLDATRMRLRQELKRLRTALGPARDMVESDKTWVRLDLEEVEVDTRVFEHHLKLAQAETDPKTKADQIQRALALYVGPLAPEIHEGWAQGARLDLKDKFERALHDLFTELEKHQRTIEIVEHARHALRLDPIMEKAVLALIRVYSQEGDDAQALKVFADYERALKSNPGRLASTQVLEQVQQLKTGERSGKKTQGLPLRPVAGSKLPTYLDGFVGRRTELSEIKSLLAEENSARLVTLLGPGGVGKTRLSVAVARSFDGQFSEIHFVSVDDFTGQSMHDRILDVLSGSKKVLLILDNAETDIESVAATARELLVGDPTLKILVTSRQRLQVAGERVVLIEPMAPPPVNSTAFEVMQNDAIRLFIERAQAIDPRFKVEQETSQELVSLLAKLDGLPLAIELAAARVNSTGITDLLRRLESRFSLLVTRRQDVPDRHRSLWAAIEWSYEALDEPAQEALQAMSVFRGGCTRELLVALAGDWVEESLDELVERSLVHVYQGDQGVRYRLLDSVRWFAETVAGPDKIAELQRRHAEALEQAFRGAFRHLGEKLEPKWLLAIDAESENALSAVAWALENNRELALKISTSVARYWCLMGHGRDAQRMLRPLLDGDLPPSSGLATCAFALGFSSYLVGNVRGAEAWYHRAYKMFREMGDEPGGEWVHLNLSAIALEDGDYPRMLALAEEAYQSFSQHPENQYRIALAVSTMARAHAFMGHAEEGIRLIEEALAIRIADNYGIEVARGYRECAEVYNEANQMERAVPLLEKAIDLFQDTPNHAYVYEAQIELAGHYVTLGQVDRAEAMLGDIEDALLRFGNVQNEAYYARLLARLHAKKGNLKEAASHCLEAIKIGIATSDPFALAEGSILAAQLLVQSGNTTAAQEVTQDILAAAQHTGYRFRPSPRRMVDHLTETLNPVQKGECQDWRALGSRITLLLTQLDPAQPQI